MEKSEQNEALEEHKLSDEQTDEASGGRPCHPIRLCPKCGVVLRVSNAAHAAHCPGRK